MGTYPWCVVVLGGDNPLGAPLIAGLEREGYIVITSVSDPDSIAEIEANGNGFVRALVFDPREVFNFSTGKDNMLTLIRRYSHLHYSHSFVL